MPPDHRPGPACSCAAARCSSLAAQLTRPSLVCVLQTRPRRRALRERAGGAGPRHGGMIMLMASTRRLPVVGPAPGWGRELWLATCWFAALCPIVVSAVIILTIPTQAPYPSRPPARAPATSSTAAPAAAAAAAAAAAPPSLHRPATRPLIVAEPAAAPRPTVEPAAPATTSQRPTERASAATSTAAAAPTSTAAPSSTEDPPPPPPEPDPSPPVVDEPEPPAANLAEQLAEPPADPS